MILLKNFLFLTIIAELIFVVPEKSLTKPNLLTQRFDPPNISEQTIYYQIKGKTIQELRQQMNQLGPHDEKENRRYDAYTRWRFEYNYRYTTVQNQCKITMANVNITIKFTMPQWRNQEQSSPEIVNHWHQYIRNLQLHENGHKQHGIDAGREMWQILQQMPAYSSCPALKRAIEEKASEITQKYGQKDKDYDKITGHGRTQSATFP